MKYWILQSSPNKFNIDEYLIGKPTIGWIVNNKNFFEGDKIFIWRAKGGSKVENYSGIIAHGKVIECKTPEDIYKDYPQLDPKNEAEGLWKKNKITQTLIGLKIKLDYPFDNSSKEAVLPRSLLVAINSIISKIGIISSARYQNSICKIKDKKQYEELFNLFSNEVKKKRFFRLFYGYIANLPQ